MDKVLIIIRGLPGSGKTTLAKTLSDNIYPIYSEDDHYHKEDGSYEWSKDKEVDAKISCWDSVIDCLQQGIAKVFVTNVFLTQKDIEPYLNIANDLGYRCHVLIAQNTHGSQSIHNVKPEDFEEMKKKFEIVL